MKKKEDPQLTELIQTLGELDKDSLSLMIYGAQMLKARMEMDKHRRRKSQPQKTA